MKYINKVSMMFEKISTTALADAYYLRQCLKSLTHFFPILWIQMSFPT